MIAIVAARTAPASVAAVDVDVVATGTPAFPAPVDHHDVVDSIAIDIADATPAATAAAAVHVIAAATAALPVAAVVAAVIRIGVPASFDPDPVVGPTIVAVFHAIAAVAAVVGVVTVFVAIAGVVAVVDHPIAAVPAVADAAASVGTLLGSKDWVCVLHTGVDIGVDAVVNAYASVGARTGTGVGASACGSGIADVSTLGIGCAGVGGDACNTGKGTKDTPRRIPDPLPTVVLWAVSSVVRRKRRAK